jgi:hypothetical protein
VHLSTKFRFSSVGVFGRGKRACKQLQGPEQNTKEAFETALISISFLCELIGATIMSGMAAVVSGVVLLA